MVIASLACMFVCFLLFELKKKNSSTTPKITLSWYFSAYVKYHENLISSFRFNRSPSHSQFKIGNKKKTCYTAVWLDIYFLGFVSASRTYVESTKFITSLSYHLKAKQVYLRKERRKKRTTDAINKIIARSMRVGGF